MINNLTNKEFLDIKFNELNNLFIQHKNKGTFMIPFIKESNSINQLVEEDRQPMISYLNRDLVYEASFDVITKILHEIILDSIYGDKCIELVHKILWELWKNYDENIELDNKIGLVLIDYKNGILSEEETLKKYNDLQDLKSKEQRKILSRYNKVDEILKLCGNKEKFCNLANEFMKTLKINPLNFFSELEMLKGFPSVNFGIEVTKCKKNIINLFYTCEQLAPVIVQVQNNIEKDSIDIKMK